MTARPAVQPVALGTDHEVFSGKELSLIDFRKFVVPHDFSVHARAALFTATDLARRLQADIHLLHIVEPPAYMYGYGAFGIAATPPPPMDLNPIREGAEKGLAEIAAGIEDLPGRIECHVVEGVGTADHIRSFAEEIGADLIVMGTHGHTGLAHVFLGSVAERTLRGAPCPVLTVQAPEDSKDDD